VGGGCRGAEDVGEGASPQKELRKRHNKEPLQAAKHRGLLPTISLQQSEEMEGLKGL
jgi:hypothetical protein